MQLRDKKIGSFVFTENGEYHNDGIDLGLTDVNVGPYNQGETDDGSGNSSYFNYGPSGIQNNGRYRVNVNLNTNIKSKFGGQQLLDATKKYGKDSKEYNKAYNNYVAGHATSLTHELFIHAESSVLDYKDDKKQNNSHQGGFQDHYTFYNSIGTDVKINQTGNNYKPQIINKNYRNLYLYEGWYVIKAVHKWSGSKKTDYEFYKMYSYGLTDRNK